MAPEYYHQQDQQEDQGPIWTDELPGHIDDIGAHISFYRAEERAILDRETGKKRLRKETGSLRQREAKTERDRQREPETDRV